MIQQPAPLAIGTQTFSVSPAAPAIMGTRRIVPTQAGNNNSAQIAFAHLGMIRDQANRVSLTPSLRSF